MMLRLVAVLAAVGASTVWAQEPFTVQLLVETGDSAPGGRTFQSLGLPVLSGSTILVDALTETGEGLFIRRGDGTVAEVMQLGDEPPGQPGAAFTSLSSGTALFGERVAFQAYWAPKVGLGEVGLYLWENGSIRRVADSTEPALPGIGVGFQFWPNFDVDGNLIFWAASSQTDMGIFRETAPGTFETLLETSTQVPWEPPGTAIDFIGPSFSANEQGLTFVGSVGDYQLVRWLAGGVIEPLATPMPGRPGSTLHVQNWVFGPPAMIGGASPSERRPYLWSYRGGTASTAPAAIPSR